MTSSNPPWRRAQPAKPTNNRQQKRDRPKRVISGGGNKRRDGGSNGDGGDGNPPPSPWLDPDREPDPHASASFVEYLRWMREPTRDYKDPTKVQILDWATEQADYSDRLKQLTDRTKKIAAIHFQVKCPWRIRVGGTKGPESILLPAFDALGMPYIPSSTLRGVARSQAVREILKDNARWQELKGLKNAEDRRTRDQAIEESKQLWQEAHRKLAPYFGSLDVLDEQKGDRAAKIVFLDAYPLPDRHGLAMDMANNIWNWSGGDGELPSYSPNPNPFLSLQEPTFLIGLRLASHCNDQKVLEHVKKWLEAGLQSGIGSQVNTGYGVLYAAGVGQPKREREFFRVDFSIEGQLIHGCQRFTQWNFHERRGWQMRGRAEAEVRPVAFKSMLRYWFRAFALGVLENQAVQTWENKLFGGIDPKNYGYLQVNILNGKIRQKEPRPNRQGQSDPCGEQQGTLVLSLSSEVPSEREADVQTLAKHLTWLMFNLGGIGQGARRPCYSRQTRDRAPWYRGSTFYIESEDEFWDAPDGARKFCQQFQNHLRKFYAALAGVTNQQIDSAERREVVHVGRSQWAEAVDRHCKILICSGSEKNGKPFALSLLHSNQFKQEGDYDGDLCGKVLRGVQPSPVWIADLGDYQVVTIFGANQEPRQQFAQELERRRSSTFSVFPV